MLNQRSRFIFTALCFGFAFLYIPILLVIIYSFNDSRLVTVWGGWSVRWYVELFNNENVLNAAILSFQIAAITATFATIMTAARSRLMPIGASLATVVLVFLF